MLDDKSIGKCNLKCPKCEKLWATLKFKYDAPVKAKDVTLLNRGRKRKLKDGDDLTCSNCDYKYTSYDVYLAIAEEQTK